MKRQPDVYRILDEALALLHDCHPIVYGSLGIELILDHDYGAHDVDVLIRDEHYNEIKIRQAFRSKGYTDLAREYLALAKDGVEVEISRLSYWTNNGVFVAPRAEIVIRRGKAYPVLDQGNSKRLYAYLSAKPDRDEGKRQRDLIKLRDLANLIES